jgi:hypothetical protein
MDPAERAPNWVPLPVPSCSMLYRVTVTTRRREVQASGWSARPSSLRTMARREREVLERSSPRRPEQAANANNLVDT